MKNLRYTHVNMLIENKEELSQEKVEIMAQYLDQSESEIEEESSAWNVQSIHDADMWRLRTQADGEFAPAILPKRRLRAANIYQHGTKPNQLVYNKMMAYNIQNLGLNFDQDKFLVKQESVQDL